MKTKYLSFCLAVSLLLIAVAGCSSMKIKTDYDPRANFMQLQSFGWMPRPAASPGVQGARAPLADNPYINDLIQRAITSELVGRKFKLGVFGVPDFLVAYHTGARRKIEATQWGYNHYREGVALHQYTEGTLVIDIIDSHTNRLLWRGAARDVISGRGNAKEKINKAVESILKNFPPQ